MEEIFDTAILGAGPAGICAAIYAARAGLKALWLDGKFVPGGQIQDAYRVDNYPGFPGISGIELGETLGNHAGKLGMTPLCETVTAIESPWEPVKAICTRKHRYLTRTVILASGATHRKLGIPGEEDFEGMGVSYCAACDGAFFRGRTVAVVGGGNVAAGDAVFLAGLCKKVYVVHRRDALRAEKGEQERLFACENVEMVWDSTAQKIIGQDQVTGLQVWNVKTGEERCLEVDGVFVAVGTRPQTKLAEDFLELDEAGYIPAGEDCVTHVPGIFAAGDIRGKNLRQVVTAMADGANAVYSAQRYLTGVTK
ncbi:MAG: thioredoxin-disulfide reductase [Clostridiales bacterium]|nr:thioredoxin-disulfide reductase [Clostridiales bacterium]